MSDPQPLFGRFTDVPGREPEAHDIYEWLCEAEEEILIAQRSSCRRQRLAAMDRALRFLENAPELAG